MLDLETDVAVTMAAEEQSVEQKPTEAAVIHTHSTMTPTVRLLYTSQPVQDTGRNRMLKHHNQETNMMSHDYIFIGQPSGCKIHHALTLCQVDGRVSKVLAAAQSKTHQYKILLSLSKSEKNIYTF